MNREVGGPSSFQRDPSQVFPRVSNRSWRTVGDHALQKKKKGARTELPH